LAFIPHKEQDMGALRLAVGVLLLLAVVNVGRAEDKPRIDKNKLVGTWTLEKVTVDSTATAVKIEVKLEFTKDCKVTVSYKGKEKTSKVSGTYSLKGDQLTTVMKGDKERKETGTITVLTDKKLVITAKGDDKTIVREFKK
jgi:uncharacterized protein (TIGR03066 family)